ncbi:unnamed protein product [Amoebophrya sp. A120]|nr:unnamed protein product [Amoebophrya sp. A120]|eukprot:GSA120T00003327001.1
MESIFGHLQQHDENQHEKNLHNKECRVNSSPITRFNGRNKENGQRFSKGLRKAFEVKSIFRYPSPDYPGCFQCKGTLSPLDDPQTSVEFDSWSDTFFRDCYVMRSTDGNGKEKWNRLWLDYALLEDEEPKKWATASPVGTEIRPCRMPSDDRQHHEVSTLTASALTELPSSEGRDVLFERALAGTSALKTKADAAQSGLSADLKQTRGSTKNCEPWNLRVGDVVFADLRARKSGGVKNITCGTDAWDMVVSLLMDHVFSGTDKKFRLADYKEGASKENSKHFRKLRERCDRFALALNATDDKLIREIATGYVFKTGTAEESHRDSCITFFRTPTSEGVGKGDAGAQDAAGGGLDSSGHNCADDDVVSSACGTNGHSSLEQGVLFDEKYRRNASGLFKLDNERNGPEERFVEMKKHCERHGTMAHQDWQYGSALKRYYEETSDLWGSKCVELYEKLRRSGRFPHLLQVLRWVNYEEPSAEEKEVSRGAAEDEAAPADSPAAKRRKTTSEPVTTGWNHNIQADASLGVEVDNPARAGYQFARLLRNAPYHIGDYEKGKPAAAKELRDWMGSIEQEEAPEIYMHGGYWLNLDDVEPCRTYPGIYFSTWASWKDKREDLVLGRPMKDEKEEGKTWPTYVHINVQIADLMHFFLQHFFPEQCASVKEINSVWEDVCRWPYPYTRGGRILEKLEKEYDAVQEELCCNGLTSHLEWVGSHSDDEGRRQLLCGLAAEKLLGQLAHKEKWHMSPTTKYDKVRTLLHTYLAAVDWKKPPGTSDTEAAGDPGDDAVIKGDRK